MDSPRVAIIILNWNGVADTSDCLQSLRAVAYDNYETILVDNASQGNDVAILRERFGDYIHIIENDRNYGFAGGCNIGIRYALGRGVDYVLLLNNDTVVDPAFLSELVGAAESLPDLAAACPKAYFHHEPNVIYSTGGRVDLWTASSRQVGRGQEDRGQFGQIAARDYADGACMLIRREALERVGLLDEDYFAYWEETDWCARAKEVGLKSYYIPTARIWHKGARSLAPTSDFYFLFRRNALLFVRKRGSPLHLASALLFYLFVAAPLYLLRHPSRIGRAVPEARALFWHVSNLARPRPLVR